MIFDLISQMWMQQEAPSGLQIVAVTSGTTVASNGNVIPTIPPGAEIGDVCYVFISTSSNGTYSANWATGTPQWYRLLHVASMSNLAVYRRSITALGLPDPTITSDMGSTRRSWISVLVRGAASTQNLSATTLVSASAQLPDAWTSNTVVCPGTQNLILRAFAAGATSRNYSAPVGDALVDRVSTAASSWSLLVSSEVVPAGTGVSKVPVMTPVTSLGNSSFSIAIPSA